MAAGDPITDLALGVTEVPRGSQGLAPARHIPSAHRSPDSTPVGVPAASPVPCPGAACCGAPVLRSVPPSDHARYGFGATAATQLPVRLQEWGPKAAARLLLLHGPLLPHGRAHRPRNGLILPSS